jgi:hypothetical protein
MRGGETVDIEKAHELRNVRITHVSLVGKAATGRRFLIAKSEGGAAEFTLAGDVLKADPAAHEITGVVYAPMDEDSHGEFMTEAEIVKAARWFARHGAGVDLMHDFRALDGAAVVENWVAKADMDIDGAKIRKGTWLVTVEVEDPAVWDAVAKGELTGFSMGGTGDHMKEDTRLPGDGEKGDKGMTQDEIQKMVDEAVAAAMADEGEEAEEDEVTADGIEAMVDAAVEKMFAQERDIQKMVDEAVAKARAEEPDVAKMIGDAVQAAIGPVLKARGLPSGIDGEEPVKKNDRHYLAGIL